MKKKLGLLLVVFMVLITVVGCGKKENENNEKEDVLLEDEVILENIKYKLDQDDEGYGIKYKIANNFRRQDLVNAINYFSENINDSPYFVIRIYHYTDKNLEESIKWSVDEYDKREDVKVGDRNFTKVHFVNYNNAETNLYFYEKAPKEHYVFVFTSSIDLSRLEDIFLKSVDFD